MLLALLAGLVLRFAIDLSRLLRTELSEPLAVPNLAVSALGLVELALMSNIVFLLMVKDYLYASDSTSARAMALKPRWLAQLERDSIGFRLLFALALIAAAELLRLFFGAQFAQA